MGRWPCTSSSSTDSSSHPCLSSATSLPRNGRDLSTDLRLGLSLSSVSQNGHSSISREQRSDWPPIKPFLRSRLAENGSHRHQHATFFVKVYMEGVAIGRKLDLLAHDNYAGLVRTLQLMFSTTIRFPGVAQVSSTNCHVLTYEDREGDWMLVGDVPWDLFLTSVKRLKITRADKC
ncbi:auxin-responsive protein IAA4-like [Aristolochia californica]|uniref:auxin-responsive protein IAA4-like n=1 Tax=Aristolochia californica TaxID=171875 RepID=UPI0035D600C6